jgi:hypothetical protein
MIFQEFFSQEEKEMRRKRERRGLREGKVAMRKAKRRIEVTSAHT